MKMPLLLRIFYRERNIFAKVFEMLLIFSYQGPIVSKNVKNRNYADKKFFFIHFFLKLTKKQNTKITPLSIYAVKTKRRFYFTKSMMAVITDRSRGVICNRPPEIPRGYGSPDFPLLPVDLPLPPKKSASACFGMIFE